MQKYWGLLTLLLAACGAAAQQKAEVGQIAGVVRFLGMAPPAQKLLVTDGTTIRHTDLVIDPKDLGLANVLVVLADAPRRPVAKDGQAAVMDQRDWVFVPRVLAIQEGQPVEFQNNDGVNHGVHANASLLQNQLNVVLGTGRSTKFSFEYQHEPIVIGCALHAWMRAWIFVVRHPWFAVTDEKGAFALRDVPPGAYRLECLHPDTKLKAMRVVEVKAGQTTKVAIDWDGLPAAK